ncbi:MAG: D-alanine--D-alanine ligase [Cytophagales bacterium]|nr:MAG: D-alanine--D-alanine ligase [Cytophagales bacterium]
MRIGIFFGGQPREREISFAGGKTVFENISKALFIPIPIFVDSLGNFILIDNQYLYENSIRDFFPPKSFIEDDTFSVYVESVVGEGINQDQMIAQIGKQIEPKDFKKHFDMAFIAMHGPQLEDGAIQGLMEWYGIPYTNSGLLGSSVGIDKIAQNRLIELVGKQGKISYTLTRRHWQSADQIALFHKLVHEIGLPLVMKAPHQGSSIGVAIVRENNFHTFKDAVNQCLFIQRISKLTWLKMDEKEKIDYLQKLTNVNEGIGMPVILAAGETIEDEINGHFCYHPQEVKDRLDFHFRFGDDDISLISAESETQLLIENFIHGKEFSCGVIQDENGEPIALPPTEIILMAKTFDFNSKYQAGGSRKRLPMEASMSELLDIQAKCKEVFKNLQFKVCTRIDGFLTPDSRVLLHDPNTIPGMSPTSLVFKQFAEIGLNPTQTITYLLRTSLQARLESGKNTHFLWKMLSDLDKKIENQQLENKNYKKIALIFGGFANPQESLQKVRKEYAKVASSANASPILIYLTGTQEEHIYYIFPFNLLFKEDINEINQYLLADKHPLIIETMKNAREITAKYANKILDKGLKISYEDISKIAEETVSV